MDSIKRLHGVYRAVVVDNKDPKNLRRLKVQSQATGAEITDWVWPIQSTANPPVIGHGVFVMYQGGDPEFPLWIGEFGKEESNKGLFSYGAWHNTQTMNAAAINTVYPMQCDTVEVESGVKLVDSSKMRVDQAGTYNIQFSAQFDKTDSGTDAVEVWLCKNGNNIANTNTELTLAGNNAKIVAAWNWFVNAAAGDYFEICWYSADSAVFINAISAGTSPTRPAIPSLILTVNQIA
jgi:hypothetical protein